jgi:hypothetical protein
MPRKTSLTPALAQAIVTAVMGGVPYYQACLMADVPHSTATDWRNRGEGSNPRRRPTPALVAFAAAVKKAEAQDEARRLLRINQAGQGGTVVSETTITYPDGRIEREVKRTSPQWQADAWYLERKYPDRYGRRVQADLTLQIQRYAQEVADEIGIDVSLVLAEAQTFLREHR